MGRAVRICATLCVVKRVALIAAIATHALTLVCPAGAQTFSDSDFPGSNWNNNLAVTVYQNISTSWVIANQATSGSPGPARDVRNFVGPVGASGFASSIVMGVNIYTASSYSPTNSNPIGAIKFGIDALCAFPMCTGGQIFGAALRQAGKDYVTCNSPGNPNGFSSGAGIGAGTTSPTWQSVTGTYSETDFCLVTITAGPTSSNPSQHPKFNGPDAIQCGFYTYIDVGSNPNYMNNGYNYSMETLYDNWSCAVVGTLTIVKAITNTTPPPLGTTFDVSVDCTTPPPSLAPGATWTSSPINYGTSCNITEPTLPQPFTNAAGATCTWQVNVSQNQTVAINSPNQSVTVSNTYSCGSQTGSLTIVKAITNATWPSGTTFSVNAQCNASNQTFNIINIGPPGTVLSPITYGTSCNITEPTLPQPFTNAAGAICTWQVNASQNQTVAISGPSQTVTVNNSYTCAPPACVAPTGVLMCNTTTHRWEYHVSVSNPAWTGVIANSGTPGVTIAPAFAATSPPPGKFPLFHASPGQVTINLCAVNAAALMSGSPVYCCRGSAVVTIPASPC